MNILNVIYGIFRLESIKLIVYFFVNVFKVYKNDLTFGGISLFGATF
jgi:hypothetical protein